MRYLILALALLVSSPAWAINEWTTCTGGNVIGAPKVRAGSCHQFRFDSTFGTSSTTIRVSESNALLTFIPDALASGGVAAVNIQQCVEGYDASDQTCANMTDSTFTGAGGSPSTQRRSIRVSQGLYRIVVSTAAAASDEAVIEVKGD